MATLTTVYGVNATKRDQTVPSVKLDPGQNRGSVRVLYDEYTVDTADEFGTSGLVKAMKIPKGATLIGGRVVCPATGATGIFNIGWAASEAEDSDGNALEAADDDGIFALIDPGAAAVDSDLIASAGFMKKFDAEVQVEIDCTEATADMGTKKIQLMLLIVEN